MKTTANIATYPGREKPLELMLKSIEGQFDEIRISINNPEKFGEFTYSADENITVRHSDKDLADNGKFFWLDHITEPENYFTLDDDLIYPKDYRRRMEISLNFYKCILTFHGRQLLGKGLHYYKGHRAFRCLEHVQTDEVIDVPGTGVMAFNTNYFHPKGLANSPDLRMCDLVFGLAAAQAGKQIGVINHSAGWIKHVDLRMIKETIYETESKNGIRRQNEIADQIYSINYES